MNAEQRKEIKELFVCIDVTLEDAQFPPTLGVKCPDRIAKDIQAARGMLFQLEHLLKQIHGKDEEAA